MKRLKITITSLIIILSFMNCSGQKKTTNGEQPLTNSLKPVLLQGYLIDPVNKTVSRQGYWERDEPNDKHAFGYDYTIDTTINFETTCLYVRDNYIEFKEHYKPPAESRFVDIWNKPMDISTFKRISDYFYEKDSIYYFVDDAGWRLQLRKVFVKSGINLQDLNYVGQNFLYDSKGLYYVKVDKNGELRLITVSKAKNCRPIIRQTYIEYNGEAFLTTLDYEDESPYKINTDATKLYEFDGNGNPYLTDGNTVFMPSYDITVWEGGVEYSKMNVLSNGETVYLADDGTVLNPPKYIPVRHEEKKVPGLNTWKKISTGQGLKVENNCITLPPFRENSDTTIYDPLYFSPKEGFFTVDFSSPKTAFEKKAHYNKIIIYNYDKRAYEEIDVNQFELHVKDFYTYKGRLYYQNVPVENDLDGKKLQYLQKIWGPDQWLSDGKQLFHIYGIEETGKDMDKKISFATVSVANIQQLKVVSEKLLVDDVNFYQFNGREIEIIPIESLGVEVKFDLSTYACVDF